MKTSEGKRNEVAVQRLNLLVTATEIEDDRQVQKLQDTGECIFSDFFTHFFFNYFENILEYNFEYNLQYIYLI